MDLLSYEAEKIGSAKFVIAKHNVQIESAKGLHFYYYYGLSIWQFQLHESLLDNDGIFRLKMGFIRSEYHNDEIRCDVMWTA